MVKFTAEHEIFRRTVREFVEKEINPYADEWEAAGTFPAHELFKKAAKLGLLGVEYDPAYGGGGADHWYTVILGEELGRADCGGVPMAITVQTDMATPALAKWGSHELKKQYLEPALKGEMVASIAVTEPDAGSDVASIKTFARRDGDEYVINGSKIYITNGTQADFLTLLARTSPEGGYRGMSLIIVPTDRPGFRVARKLRKLGNHSSDTAELVLEDVRVPVTNRIGEEGQGFYLQMQQFQKERLIAVYTAIGGMRRAIERTVAYLRERKAFGGPLLSMQYIQYTLAELIVEIESLRQLAYAAAEGVVAGEDVTRLATMAKFKAGRLVRRVADTCLQFHGGLGYMEEMWTARYFRDSRLLGIGGGADEVMLRVLTRTEGLEA
ncbi:Acyl-CoA dehydrogenase [bacterium HR29]|jgi:citronellyl-CoA dehydrogenase|nr:Acyl-CoA dehydrogenase [bacterium HR29]